MTFHIGDEKAWNDEKYLDYAEYNLKELNKIISYYQSKNELPTNHPVISHIISNNNINNWIFNKNQNKNKYKLIIKKLFGRSN